MSRFMIRWVSVILVILTIGAPLRLDFYNYSTVVYAEDESSQPLEDLYIDESVTWNSNTDLSMYENIYVLHSAYIYIEPGSTIAMRNLTLYDLSFVIAEGTAQNPITITQLPINTNKYGDFDPECNRRASGTISFKENSYGANESIFSYVTFREMGTYIDMEEGDYTCPAMVKSNFQIPSFINSAYAEQPAEYYDPYGEYPLKASPAIYFHLGNVRMSNCTFENNEFADVVVDMEIDENTGEKNVLHIINSNFQNNKNNVAVRSRVKKNELYNEFFEDCYSECINNDPDLPWMTRSENCSHECTISVDYQESFFDDNRVELKNNWYGHNTGPKRENDLYAQGERVYGNLTLDGWRQAPDMASNVLFLPGIKASRLYDADNENKLWLPDNDEDATKLLMDEDGKSMNNIYTKDVIENAYAISGIYDEFVEDLESLKNGHIITDFSLYAYDWRKDVADIAQNGTLYPDNEVRSAVAEIERLASTSVSGQVTIVAHSNGGLLGKALVQELDKKEESYLIDNVIFVSAPQMGTPKAITSLLHGYDEALPFFSRFVDDADAREMGENMPGAYGLLPSKEYFDRAEEPIINFDATNTIYKRYKDAYGDHIDNYDEFKKFVLGKKDMRPKPDRDNLVGANVLNEKILNKAEEIHDNIDTWIPPENIKLIQIGGWGLDTMSGVKYTEINKSVCKDNVTEFGIVRADCKEEPAAVYEPKYTVDGDDVVVTPSSLMIPTAENVEKYWLDLFRYNKSNLGFTIDRKHGDILEMQNLRILISYLIEKHTVPENLLQYFSSYRPQEHEEMENPRIRMSLYSPLDIHLYDEHGNHTGPTTMIVDGEEVVMIEENIPNSYYEVFGEHKFVGWGTDDDVRVELDGYDSGSYTFNIQEVYVTENGERDGDNTTFESLPVSADTTVNFTVPADGIKDMTALTADYDGDGTVDYTITPQINGSATFDDEDDRTLDFDDNSDVNTDADPEKKVSVGAEKSVKASIDSWKAYQYMTKSQSCPTKLKLILTGKHFDKDAIIKIGGRTAKDLERESHRKITATFCMKDLLKIKTDTLRTISVINPDTERSKAIKKIDVLDIVWYVTPEEIQGADINTVEGCLIVQKALNQLEYIDAEKINGQNDALTQNAITQFQKERGLPQTGFYGLLTKEKLIEKIIRLK